MRNLFQKKMVTGPRKLYTLDHPKASISEAFRMLRTNLMYTGIDREFRIILFTSAGPKEGKSVTAANLSAALAQTGKKVLIMDCDLRKPVQHEIFGVRKEVGLTKYLTGYCSWDEAVQTAKLSELDVLASGPIPPNPAELLGSKSMDHLLETVREQYDFIIVDAPPVAAVADPIILAGKCDGVIVVVRAGFTKMVVLKEAYELLKKADAHVIGAVLNDANLGSNYYNKRYGKYYNNYYKE